LIFGGLAFAIVAAFLIFIGFIGEDLTSQGWKLVAICGGVSLVLLAGGALLLRSERYRSRSWKRRAEAGDSALRAGVVAVSVWIFTITTGYTLEDNVTRLLGIVGVAWVFRNLNRRSRRARVG
jgi:hypothetical protein